MSNPKAHHYAKEFEGALSRGAWLESKPVKDYKGNQIDWEETIRKFKKHCPGQDAFATIALQTQTLATLLLRPQKSRSDATDAPPTLNLSPEGLDGDSDSTGAPFALNLNDEYLIPEDKREEARMALVALSGEDEKVKDTWSTTVLRAFFAYTLDKPQRVVRILATVNLENTIPQSPAALTAPPPTAGSHFIPSTTLSTASTATSSSFTPGAGTGSALQTILSRTGSIASSVGAPTGARQTFSWGAVEHIRTRCIEGMAHERLMDGTAASLAYEAALPLIAALVPKPGEPGVFEARRELWRWVEMLLYRASIVAATHKSSEDAASLMRVYCVVATHWPPSFRPNHRATLYTLYIRTLCLTSTRGSLTWRDEARRAVTEMRAALNATTVFPKAGQVNHKVLDFADGCVALWEAGGEHEEDAVWAVDTLWWATRLTFHSHRVLRHLSRLLLELPEPDIDVARRVFQLYVRLVRTARLTSSGDVDLQLQRRPTDEPAEHPAEIAKSVASDPGSEFDKSKEECAKEVQKLRQGDRDDARTFVDALVKGARMLCRMVEERGAGEALAEAQEAVKLAQEVLNTDPARLQRDNALRARVLKVAGIVEALTAAKELDPTARPNRQSTALQYLLESSALDPTSADTFYHLAFAQAEARATGDAVLSARQAVERAPRDVRGWHLLGLLLTAMEDWAGAKAVIELGIANAEEIQDDSGREDTVQQGDTADDSLVVKDFGAGARASSPGDMDPDEPHPLHYAPVVVPPTGILPPSRTLLVVSGRTEPDASPSKLRTFAAATQIRLTEMAIVEKIEGADGAAGMWPGVFAWYAANAPSAVASVIGAGNGGGSGSIRTASIDHGDESHMASSVPRMEFSPASPTNEYDSGREKEKEKSGKHLDLHKKLLSKSHGHVRELSRRINPKARRRMSTLSRSASTSEPYQASSIHSRHLHRRSSPATSAYFEGESDLDPLSMTSSMTSTRTADTMTTTSTVRTTQTSQTSQTAASDHTVQNSTSASGSSAETLERRLLSDIWLASAATFRRSSRPAEAVAAISEAEWLDETNPNVWVQFGLYLSQGERAVEALHKALVIEPEHVPAVVHLAQIYLGQNEGERGTEGVDMAVGMLNQVTQGAGWDAAEAWYLLGRACGLQGRRERQRECLAHALRLEESKSVRSVQSVLPRCL